MSVAPLVSASAPAKTVDCAARVSRRVRHIGPGQEGNLLPASPCRTGRCALRHAPFPWIARRGGGGRARSRSDMEITLRAR